MDVDHPVKNYKDILAARLGQRRWENYKNLYEVQCLKDAF